MADEVAILSFIVRWIMGPKSAHVVFKEGVLQLLLERNTLMQPIPVIWSGEAGANHVRRAALATVMPRI